MKVESNKIERRNFLKYLGAVALGSGFKNLLTIKKRNVEHLIPYVIPPDGVVPGVPNWYASVCRQCNAGCGISVKVREGRAIKIEGNDKHPVNKGKICARGQAGVQVLYNPDRVKGPMIKENGKFREASWNEALTLVTSKLKSAQASGADKIVYVGDPQRGSLGNLLKGFFDHFGSDNIYFYDYFDDKTVAQANNLAFGYDGIPDYDINNARFIVSLGANFLESWASPVKHSVSYGDMRDITTGNEDDRGWLVQFEPRLSVTGSSADEWYPIKPHTEGLIALAMAHTIVNEDLYDKSLEPEIAGWEKALADYTPSKIAKKAGLKSIKKLNEVARGLAEAGSQAIAIAGGSATAQENGLFNALAASVLNYLVGSVTKEGGLRFPAPSDLNTIKQTASYDQMKTLVDKIGSGQVEIAFVHNTNPAFTLPASLNLGQKFTEISFKVSFSHFIDETSALADVILPDSTYLESWGDHIPLIDNGRKSIGLMQPAVDRLFNTRMLGDTIILLAKRMGGKMAAQFNYPNFRTYLKNSWNGLYEAAKGSGQTKASAFLGFWYTSVKRGGFWYNTESYLPASKKPSPALLTKPKNTKIEGEKFALQPYPSAGAYDGRGANQPWLQQLPEPLVTATWHTWAEINPETAKELGVEEGDIIEISSRKGEIKLPAYLFPAIEPKTIAVPVGRGHKEYGRYAKGYGKNILEVLEDITNSAGSLAWAATKVTVEKGNGSESIVKTEPEKLWPTEEAGLREHERELIQWIDPEEYKEISEHNLEPIEALPNYRRKDKKGYRWGMVIDLDKCTGCSACMVACYAENNLPIINDKQLLKNRHKNWIRVDRYWEGEYPNVRAKVMPANCYQCGKATCEPVCPVYAAFHTKDSLNGQVYQRCVGTRYCNVACPYRVRLFNWFRPEWPEPLTHQLNPEISVRSAGITEKCTFCVQRIRMAKDKAKDELRLDKDGEPVLRDGEITPACAQTCPSGAITFGDLLDKNSKVSKLTSNPRRYRVLEELDIEPAVVYLKAVRKGAVEHKKENEEERVKEHV